MNWSLSLIWLRLSNIRQKWINTNYKYSVTYTKRFFVVAGCTYDLKVSSEWLADFEVYHNAFDNENNTVGKINFWKISDNRKARLAE